MEPSNFGIQVVSIIPVRGDSDFLPENVKEGVSFENLSINGILPEYHVITPQGLSGSFTTSPDQMNVTWDNMSVTGYILIAREGSAVTWTPTHGTSYSTGSPGIRYHHLFRSLTKRNS